MTYKRGITVVIVVGILQTVDLQMMFPAPQSVLMMPPQPMAVMPPPPPPVAVPVPFPVPVPVLVTKKTTTTTTTETPEENNGNIILLPPFGNPFAAPVIVMPLPSSHIRLVEYDTSSDDESESYESDSSKSSSSGSRVLIKKFVIDEKGRRRRIRVKELSGRKRRFRAKGHGKVKKHRRRVKNYRKSFRSKRNLEPGDRDFVKPVLSYISKRGNVKFKTRINADDAARLTGKKDMYSEGKEPVHLNQNQHLNQVSGLRVIQSEEYGGNSTAQYGD